MMNGNIFQVINMLKRAGTPEQILQKMLSENPQAKSFLEQIQNSTQGATPESVAMQLARQRGISESDIRQMAELLGYRK